MWKLISPPPSHPHRGTWGPQREQQSPGQATGWQGAWLILHTLAPSWLGSQQLDGLLQEGHQELGLNELHRGAGWPCWPGCPDGAEESRTVRGNCKACVPSPSDPAFVSSTCCAVLPWSMQLTLGLLLLPPPHLAHLGAGKTSFLLSSSEQGMHNK